MDIAYMKNFECPICLQYLHKPIFQCPTGHSFCFSCKSRLAVCSFCGLEFANTRNYALESVVNDLTLKCKNDQCTKIIPLHNYSQHMNDCKYSAVKCKVPNCKWSNSVSLLNEHIKSEHKSIIVKSNDFLQTHQIAFSIVKYKTHMFYLRRYSDTAITWTVESTCPSNDKFILCIRIITASGECHVLKQPCSNKVSNDEALKNKSVLCLMKGRAKGCKFQVVIENDK